jgi:hypothetical protein
MKHLQLLQPLIFIYGTDENFPVTEELAGLCSMTGCTTGKVIKNVTEKLGLAFNNLMAVCTDGPPSI